MALHSCSRRGIPWYVFPENAQRSAVVQIELILLLHALVLLCLEAEAVEVQRQRQLPARCAQLHGIAAIRRLQHGLPGASALGVTHAAQGAATALHFCWPLLHVLLEGKRAGGWAQKHLCHACKQISLRYSGTH